MEMASNSGVRGRVVIVLLSRCVHAKLEGEQDLRKDVVHTEEAIDLP